MTRRFCRYIEKMFGFSRLAGMIEDSRVEPQIPVGAAWLSGLFMFALRRGSLNAIDGDLRVPGMMERVVGRSRPSGDSIGRIFCLLATGRLRAILAAIAHKLKRSKVLVNEWPLRFAALDGHELFSLTLPLLPEVSRAHRDCQGREAHRVLSPHRCLPSYRLRDPGAARC